MRKTLFALALIAAVPALAQDRLPRVGEPNRPTPVEVETIRVPMQVGQSAVFRAPAEFRNVAIAIPEIADGVPTSDRQLLVHAKKEGMTSVVMSAEDGRAIAMVEVEVIRPQTYGRDQIRVRFPHGREQRPDQYYWCNGPLSGGCDPDSTNQRGEIQSEFTFILPSPSNGGIGRSQETVSFPRR